MRFVTSDLLSSAQIAKITDEVLPGILSSTFHFPEIMLNIITSNEHDSEALCPEYKVVSCRIRKSKGKYKKEMEAKYIS